jgi:hypothetical protein
MIAGTRVLSGSCVVLARMQSRGVRLLFRFKQTFARQDVLGDPLTELVFSDGVPSTVGLSNESSHGDYKSKGKLPYSTLSNIGSRQLTIANDTVGAERACSVLTALGCR